MKAKYFSAAGEPQEEKDLALPTFEGERGMTALRDVALAYQNNFRQGDAHTKNRAEVSGSGKKPYRQKGTGMARRGEKRSPICSGGGVTFGPRKRDYTVKINKKMRQLALARSLFNRLQNGDIVLVEELKVEGKPSTKRFSEFLKKIQIDPKESVLLLDTNFSGNVILSSRNLPNVFTLDARSLNAWQSFYCDKMVMTLRAAETLATRVEKETK
jgi:large subunit ribosomal protein L4